MSGADYGRTLTGLSVNIVVRNVQRSLPFYRDVLGLTCPYSDPDFAALQGDGVRLTLHADHTYERMPWAEALAGDATRGLGAEIRILGIEPEAAERRARELGFRVVIPTRDWAHGWRDVFLQDPDGYVFSVGVPTPAADRG